MLKIPLTPSQKSYCKRQSLGLGEPFVDGLSECIDNLNLDQSAQASTTGYGVVYGEFVNASQKSSSAAPPAEGDTGEAAQETQESDAATARGRPRSLSVSSDDWPMIVEPEAQVLSLSLPAATRKNIPQLTIVLGAFRTLSCMGP